MNNLPFVSVVITTKNEEKNIENCIKSIKTQTYPEDLIEIIVVDNNSTDRTKEIARKYTKNVFNKGPERSAQRNYGIRKAKGGYILFLDADMSLSEKVIGECVEKFSNQQLPINNQQSKLVGLYIPEIIHGNSFWCKVRNFERSFYNGTVIDAIRFFPKKVWEEVGGFDENLAAGEDWDFDRRIRHYGNVEIIKSKLFHNEKDFNLSKYIGKKSFYAKDILKYVNKWGKDDVDIKKQLGVYYRYFGVFIEDGKWKKLVVHPVLALGMLFLKGFVGFVYLINKI